MSKQFAFPFGLSSAGRPNTVDQQTELGRRDMVAHLMMTRRREREMRPNFGITDPSFAGIDTSEILSNVAAYLKDENVGISSIDVIDRGDGTQQVSVNVT